MSLWWTRFFHRGGNFIHPQGGKNFPEDSTKLVLHSGSQGGQSIDALMFCMVPEVIYSTIPAGNGWFKIKHKSGKYVHPLGGVAGNNVCLCLHRGDVSGTGGPNACFFRICFSLQTGNQYFHLQHSSGLFVHPKGGRLNPPNETELVLWPGMIGHNNQWTATMFAVADRNCSIFNLDLSWYLDAFHQTDHESAHLIKSSGQFLPGTKGALGAGAYFCPSVHDTDHKARKPGGWIIQVKLDLGRSHIVNAWDGSITKENLEAMGFDSVAIQGQGLTEASGWEYVIYDMRRVKVVGVQPRNCWP